jgi:uncharacterized cupin superfamily protein
VVPEAPVEQEGKGLAPGGPGWFVLNVRDARWRGAAKFGWFTPFESREGRFEQLGVNVAHLDPGQPACYYHREGDQEDFLVLAGEALLLIEGEERPLKQWDFVHCPPWTDHVIIGAGEEGCTVLAVGARDRRGVVYPESELAQRHNAGAQTETDDPRQAYVDTPEDEDVEPDTRWLP